MVTAAMWISPRSIPATAPRPAGAGRGAWLGPRAGTAAIRAELGDVARFCRVEQVIADAGLEPRTHESGRASGQRGLSKRGAGALHLALYLATLAAVRFRPEWQ